MSSPLDKMEEAIRSMKPGEFFRPGDMANSIGASEDDMKLAIVRCLKLGMVEPVYKVQGTDAEWTRDLASLSHERDPKKIMVAFERTEGNAD